MPTTVRKMGSPYFVGVFIPLCLFKMDPAQKTGSEGGSISDPLRLPAEDSMESAANRIKNEVDTEANVTSTLSETCAGALASPVKMEVKETESRTPPILSTDVLECAQAVSVQCEGKTDHVSTWANTGGMPGMESKLNVSLNGNSHSEGEDAIGGNCVEVNDCGDNQEKKTNNPGVKIIPIEILLQENQQQLPKFVTEGSENVTLCEKTGRGLSIEETVRDEEFRRWERTQKAKERSGTRKPRNSAFRCDICSKFLSSQGNLRLHKVKRHKVKTPFCCKVCGLEFDYCREVVQHRNKVHRNKEGLFECHCGKTTFEFHNFLTHLAGHRKNSKEQPLDTKDGDAMCVGNKTKDDKKEFICEYCGKKFKRPDSLKTHLNLIHMEDGGEMAERVKNSVQEKNFVCDACGRRFSFQCLLHDHLNLHTGLKPYVCPECGRTFSQKASLQQHLKAHGAERRFKCVECPAAFFSRGDLTKHVRKHTGERPYICEVCGEGYAQSSHLNVHRRSHSGERPFSCDLCGRAFTKSSDAARHRRIHTGEFPFLCQVCGKGFRQSAQCQNHIKNHHPETVTG